jgi:ABC-type Co2+ transport system permease subunit
MHVSPGVVEGPKMVLSYATSAVAFALAAKSSYNTIRADGGIKALVWRSIATTAQVLFFFQVLPHYVVGVSEVHFIFGAALYLVFGAGPTAIGLAAGLLLQGLLFRPTDLPQYFINVTTLIVPLLVVSALVKRIVPNHTPYVDIKYRQLLALSAAYQGGVIALVALWCFYGRGFGVDNVNAVWWFALNYLVVIVVEPVICMLLLALAKKYDYLTKGHPLFYNRLHHEVA